MGLASSALPLVLHDNAHANAHAAKKTTVTTKGFSCTNANVANVNALIGGTVPTFIKTSFGEQLWNPDLVYAGGVQWAISLAFLEEPLTAANVTLATKHPNYSGWWILGNEEYGEMTPQAFWDRVKPQRDLVYSIHPQAKFVLPAGILNEFVEIPHWAPNSWYRQLIDLIPNDGKKGRFKAYHFHAYPGSSYTLPGMMAEDEEFRATDFPNMESWISEIGRPLTSGADKFNPAYVYQKAAQFGINKVFWYRQERTGGSGDNYFMLRENGANTAYGEMFKAI